MVDVHDTFPDTDFLKAEDLGGASYTFMIAHVETIEYDDGNKLKISFQDTDRIFVANKTNALIITEHHGPNTDHWSGQHITLYPTKVSFGSKMVPAIRVREKEVPMAQAGANLGGQPAQDANQRGTPGFDPAGRDAHPNQPGMDQAGDPGIGQPSATTKRPL